VLTDLGCPSATAPNSAQERDLRVRTSSSQAGGTTYGDNSTIRRFGICAGGAFFHQLSPQFSNDFGEPFLSPFLRGGSVTDPVSGSSRAFNDLRRRRFDLESLVCAPPTRSEAQRASLRRGIARVH
jgi:hypothetical protein